jgi:CheY-like chemotaxis protein
MVKQPKHFLIVDDDPQNNFLAKMALRKAFGEVEVTDFVIPEDALFFIENEFTDSIPDGNAILFLDINMPTMDGWEFLEAFNTFRESIKKKLKVYMLSSSVDPADVERANVNPNVISFLEKPLSKEILVEMFS